ncbi:MAG TPA: DUF1572 family protein [Terriglobales bacterium]|nr:DUF1572 family protein [Terriglobales bacterium]
MSIAKELGAMYRRDLTRLAQHIDAFPNDAALWQTHPAVTNSAGNLALHIEGNLREFVGRQIGGNTYTRKRDLEFSSKGVSKQELESRLADLKALIPSTIEKLSSEQLETQYPQTIFERATSTQELLISLYGHLNWHMGQIDYLRRILNDGKAVKAAGLEPLAK